MAGREAASRSDQRPDSPIGYRRPQAIAIGPVTRITGGLGNYTSEENGYRIG